MRPLYGGAKDKGKAKPLAVSAESQSGVPSSSAQQKPGKRPVVSGADNEAIRGVTNRTNEAWALFRDLARGDFKHDFGEREKTRDLITNADEARFFEIAKQVSKKGAVWLRAQFKNKYVGQTLFQLFGNDIDRILPPVPKNVEPEPGFYDEVGLLQEKIDMNFELIKGKAVAKGEGEEWNETFQAGGITRDYTLRSANYRLGKRGEAQYKQNQNVTKIFNKVTGGQRKFVLIVDASGGLPLSDLLNSDLLDAPAPGNEFYIIENIENTSDSATKLSGLKKRGAGVFPEVFFLRDTANTVVYPLWENSGDPKSNVFSSMKIILNRITDDEVEANLLILDKTGKTVQAINIGDVSNSSNVKNATLRALANFIENGIVPETLAYTLIKRMGDWCQALSMLDLDRAYEVLNTDRSDSIGKTTLRKLMADSEVGVVTNDRILLGVCILLGLNVFYTTAMDIAKVIYFKNKNDLPSDEDFKVRAVTIYKSISPRRTPAAVTALASDLVISIESYKDGVVTEEDLPEYIFKLKCFTANIGKIRNEYATYAQQIADNEAVYNAAASSSAQKFAAANTLSAVGAKILLDQQHNDNLFQNIADGVYEDSSRDRIRIDSLKKKLSTGGRIAKSVEVTEAKNILLTVRDDLLQILGKNNLALNQSLKALLDVERFRRGEDDRKKGNYDELLSVLPAIKLVLPEAFRGGGRQIGGAVTIEELLIALQARSVRLIEGGAESTSTVNIYTQGGDYIDEKLRRYTVADQYIVTADDLPTFDLLFELGEPPDPPPIQAQYMYLKYLLLQLDIAKNELENIDEERTVTKESTTVKATGVVTVVHDNISKEVGEDLEADVEEPTIIEYAETVTTIYSRRRKLEPGSVEYERYVEYRERCKQINAFVKAKDFVNGAVTIYKRLPPAGPLEDFDGSLFQTLVAEIAEIAPPSRVEEAPETSNIEQSSAQLDNRIGIFRESIVQESLSNLVLDEAQMRSLGETIEGAVIENIREAVLDFAYLTPDSDPPTALPDTIPDAIANVFGEWIDANEPSVRGSVNAAVDLARVRAKGLVDEINAEQAEAQEVAAAVAEAAAGEEVGEEEVAAAIAAAGEEEVAAEEDGRSNAAAGGLRTRRPLYSNARPTASHHVDGPSDHEGLRKRTGTRTHRRLRKSSRVTRRR